MAEKRETIEKIRNDKNKMSVEPDKQWPSMYRVVREKGGALPGKLRGSYTSKKLAEENLAAYLG